MKKIASTIRVYDQQLNQLVLLENAFSIGYELNLNALSYANFSIPADDPKNDYLKPFYFFELYDAERRIGMYRLIGNVLTRSAQGVIKYELEHCAATLLDSIMFKYHQIGNLGVYTREVAEYVLSFQETRYWILGDCEFSRQFEYKFENENLLGSLFSIANVFDEPYVWEFDDSVLPWVVHLRKRKSDFVADIMYKKNMESIVKTTDSRNIVTKLYALGSGEGVNQVNIASVNGGKEFIMSDTVAEWGIKTSILVDRRFEYPDSLLAYARAVLEEVKKPYVSYKVQAIDLFRWNPQIYKSFVPGEVVRVVDKEDGIAGDFPIVKVSKSDLTGDPGRVVLEIVNKSKDVAGSITDLQNRARINEVYSQGATNLMTIPFNDNADPSYPAIFEFYIPSEMARINKVILHYRLERFRADTRAISSTAQSAPTTSSTNTTAPTTSSQQQTSPTTTTAGATSPTTANNSQQTTASNTTQTSSAFDMQLSNIRPDSTTSSQYTHNHGINAGERLLTGLMVSKNSQGLVTDVGETYTRFVWSGAHTHGSHSHSISGHTHTVSGHSHSVTISGHSHSVTIAGHSHTVTIPGHNHSVTIPGHTHAMEHGIYLGSQASSVTVRVDGRTVPLDGTGDVDVVNYLSADSGGRILRNAWHRVEIYPNNLTRIRGSLFIQLFTQSRGGSDL
jgi:phage minor structural protein, N-terminal region